MAEAYSRVTNIDWSAIARKGRTLNDDNTTLATRERIYLVHAEAEQPTNANLWLPLAEANFKLARYEECLSYLDKHVSATTSSQTDPILSELLRARCHRGLKRVQEAVQGFRRVIDHEAKYDGEVVWHLSLQRTLDELRDEAADDLFHTLNAQNMHQTVVSEVLSWHSKKKALPSYATQYWVQYTIILAVYNTGSCREVSNVLETFAKGLETETDATSEMQRSRLLMTVADIWFYCSQLSEDHEAALDIWDHLTDSNSSWRDQAIAQLSRVLLDKVISKQSGSLERLVAFTQRADVKDEFSAKRALARSHLLAKNSIQAKSILRSTANALLDSEETRSRPVDSDHLTYLRMSKLLAAVDDDVNAIAALQRNHIGYRRRNRQHIGLFACDGPSPCTKSWPDASDFWVCKFCNDIVLCPSCYEEMRAGRLPPWVCSPHHQHLYIPFLQLETRNELEPDRMLVDGQIVDTKTWLDRLRVDWDLAPGSVWSRPQPMKKDPAALRWWRYSRVQMDESHTKPL